MPDPITPTSEPAVLETPASTEQVVPDSSDPNAVVTEQPDGKPEGSDPNAAPSQPDPLAVLETLQLDPKTKEVLKAGFLRQADYTKKTQEIAEIRQAAEAYRQWTPIISFLQQNPNIAESMFGATKPKVNPTDEELPDDPKEFMKLVQERSTQAAIETLRRETAINSDIDSASKLDARLNTDEGFAKQIAGFIEVNFGNDVRAGKMSVTEATQKALDAHKQYEDSVRQKTISEVTASAKKKTMVIPSGSGSPLPTTAKGGPMSMREAAQKAEEEINSR